jgi:CheY-like chemotaxis protein
MIYTKARQELMRVLVAAATREAGQAYVSACQGLNAEVTVVSSGCEAVESLRRGFYDVVVADDSVKDVLPFELSLYVRDFARDRSHILLVGFDLEQLPTAVRRDKKLYSAPTRHAATTKLRGLLGDMEFDRQGVVRTAFRSDPEAVAVSA